MGKHLISYGGGNLKTHPGLAHYADTDLPTGGERRYTVLHALTGETGSLFKENPWRLAWESVPDQIQPGAIELTTSDPWDLSNRVKVAVLWDDAHVVKELSMDEGATRIIQIPKVWGTRLTIWMDDENSPTVRWIPPNKVEAAEKAVADESKKTLGSRVSAAADNAAAAAKDASNNLKWTVVAFAVLAVAGAVVYLKAK